MNEIASFEGFKFNIGDLVVHVSDDHDDSPSKGIITRRALVQDVRGVAREYVVSFRTSEVAVQEMELALYRKPLRTLRG